MTVIIPSWQTRDLLLDCIAGLLVASEAPRPRIVVVDNASADGSADAVAARFQSVVVLRNADNAGFAAAVNRGLDNALAANDGPAVILNADTRCTPAALTTLARHLDEHPGVGLVGPRVLLPDGTPQPYAFGGDPTIGYLLRRGWNRIARGRSLHEWSDASTFGADWVTFACVAARLDMVRAIGPMDAGFFMYFEDNDWCLRARRAGWAVVRDGEARIVHIGGASLRQNPAAVAAYRASLRRFHDKHYSAASRLLLRMLLPVYALPLSLTDCAHG